MKNKKSGTNLGRYLYSLRIERGVAKIREYLRKYKLPISDVYYRDVESGAKIVSMETAAAFCDALRAERRVFYFHLLRDILPADVAAMLLRHVADETFSSLEERQALLERDKSMYREALAKSMMEETYVLSDDAVRTLLVRPDLMPVLHFLYATECGTAEQLAVILDQNAIPDSPVKVAQIFATLGMATVEGDLANTNGWSLKRKTVISRVPLTEKGLELKRAFALREVSKTLQQNSLNATWANTGSFVDSSILELSPEAVTSVRARVLDAIAEARAAEEPISGGRATPYFLGIFFGSRTEYSPKSGANLKSGTTDVQTGD